MKTFLVASLILIASQAQAAGMKICFDDGSINQEVTKVRVFSDTNPLFDDILSGSTLSGTKRCNTKDIPATFVRGVNVQITLKSINSFGEESPASNALPFRAPLTPNAITGATLSIVVP